MTYNSFYSWVRGNRVLAIPLILLFVFGTIFQVTDTIDRVKGWFTSETHNILHVKSHVDDLGVDGSVINRAVGGAEIFHALNLRTKVETNGALVKALLTGANDLWLVRIEGTDVLASETLEDGSVFDMRFGLEEGVPFVMNMAARDGEAALEISIHFPNIDPARPWADFESEPVTCCYGVFSHTAFYRFTEYKEKGQLLLVRNFKAQYIEPDAALAQKLLDEVETGAYKQLYFEDKPEPENGE